MDNQIQMQKHTKIIGNIFIILGSLSLIGSLLAFILIDIFQYSFIADEIEAIDLGILRIDEPIRLFYFLPGIISVFGALKLIAGLGVINKKPWAEGFSLFLAIFMFFNAPIGTAFAVYIFYTFLLLKNTQKGDVNSAIK